MRRPVNKKRSSQKFRSNLKRTKGANVVSPQRGGYRL